MKKAVKKDVAKAKTTGKKKVVRKKRKVGARKAARKAAKKKVVRKRRRKAKKVAKVTKTGKRRGRPPLKKKAGRKPRAAAELITLPVNNQTDVDFWSNMVAFLNKNKSKSFIIQLDGKSFSLGVQ